LRKKPKNVVIDYKCIPVIEEAPNHPEGAIQDISNNCHSGKEVVVINEGEAKGLGEIGDYALGELDTQEASPNLERK
jgi:hypothetical protein